MRWSNSSAVAPVDDEGIHALARDSRRQHPPAGGAGHVGVLALRVDDVGPHAPADAAQQSQLGGEGLARTGAGQYRRIGVQVGAVEGVVDDGGAGSQVDAVQCPAAGVQVRRREWEQSRQAGRVQRPPYGHGVQRQGQGGQQTFPLPEGQGVQLAQGGGEVGAGLLGQLLQGVLVVGVEGDGEGGVEQPLPAPLHLVPEPAHILQGDLGLWGQAAAPVQG